MVTNSGLFSLLVLALSCRLLTAVCCVKQLPPSHPMKGLIGSWKGFGRAG
jgi:hypothetical protein